MLTEILVIVIASLVVAFIAWVFKGAWSATKAKRDRRLVLAWLRDHTEDYPHKSHKSTTEIAKGTALPVERVQRACETEPKIFRFSAGEKTLWSVWRENPQSIYDKRGLTVF